ncbi:L-seryl-tRNA(Sec) kinase-like isoform X1 [Oncorhynchus masou masou]|uniref:L-seryl-tRNA(Sec) kinase-like isoform X1 n=1 Tax=Oncorhynchus masou masou TaxID=90313 RepID=UPI003184466D
MCTRICLCVLCGLPAAGKSTLAQAVNSHSVQRGWRSAVISYDDLIPGDAFNVKEVEEDIPRSQTQTQWKCHRQTVLRCVEHFLQSPTEQLPPIIYQINSDARSRLLHAAQVCGTPTGSPQVCGTPSDRPPPPLVILLDDNFYYPSMRYEVYQLARKHSVGFCQVYVHCPVESCVKRNQLRPQPLPSDVIVEMAKRMEPPNPQRNPWEQNSVTLDSEHHFTMEYIQRLVKVISTALENPLSPVQDNAEQKEADRQSCVSSVVHQADRACRRLVSQAMQEAREHQLPPERMRSLAADLNESKTMFLQDLRRQVLQPLTQGEGVEVERVVNGAVDVFNKEKQEIIARYLPPCDRIK